MAAVGGVYEGIDGIRRFLTDVEEAAPHFRMELDGVEEVDSKRVIAFLRNNSTGRASGGDDRESVGIILCAERDEVTARFALHRVYAPIAVSPWTTGSPQPALPPVEVTDDVPEDLSELAQVDEVRTRLIDRVTRRASEITDREAEQNTD